MAEASLILARSELILGGQKSGKSRRAESLARDWLARSATHHAVLIATAQPWDDEMRERIARHRLDRAARVPGMITVEEPLALAVAMLLETMASVPGPLVLVGNEIGLGVIPLGAPVRAFVDALGRLNQEVAAVCQRVTLMAAGLPLNLKDAP